MLDNHGSYSSYDSFADARTTFFELHDSAFQWFNSQVLLFRIDALYSHLTDRPTVLIWLHTNLD